MNPTPHRFRVNGRTLYTWCSLDAVFLPGLLGKTAEVTSTCPVTGEPLHLTIAPDGIVKYKPATIVLSITVPGLSCKTAVSDHPETGPHSDGCSQMHFFSSQAAAEQWLIDRPNIAILTVTEAYQLAEANWISRRKGAANSNMSGPIRDRESCCCG